MATSLDPDNVSHTPDEDNRIDLDEEDRQWLDEGRKLEQQTLKPQMLLGWPSVVCIIANRMIGSGIFLTPSTLIQLTQSVGITLLFWVAGACTTLCGMLMFMEYGLTSPRFRVQDDPRAMKNPLPPTMKRPLPRSGGDLHYLKDVLPRPMFFVVSLYGIAFVLLGNIATNSMAFGVRVLQAAGRNDPSNDWEARAIALAIVTFTCALHSLWRIGGIRLSNIFAVVKIIMLLFIFVTGCLTWGGVFKRNSNAVPNMTAPDAFKNPSKDPYAFAEAYLSIVFAFGGFNQANYVLGEVREPKKNYKLPAFLAVLGVCILYLLVNVAYMLVVPAEEQKAGVDVATRFFELTYGTVSSNGKEMAPRILAAFMAISALGNLIVMTYTAARVKQEIAKEGILPFYDFLANNRVILNAKDNPVPLGALVLHWAVSIVLVLGTASMAPILAYRVLVGLYSYTIDAIFGVALAIGIFVLRTRSHSFGPQSILNGWVSLGAAAIYGASMAFPLITSWVPPSSEYLREHSSNVPWYAIATASWCAIGLGILWWIGFRWVYPLKPSHSGKQLVIQREMIISDDTVMEHETIVFSWKPGDPDAPKMTELAFTRPSHGVPMRAGEA